MRRRRSRHANLPLQLTTLAAVVIFLGYAVAYPFFQAWLRGDFTDPMLPLEYTFFALLKLRITEAFIACWFFATGAAVGSFLNVVAYRLPPGESVIAKPSHCPYCDVPIKPWHNVPIFGWLRLRARCAACRLPISPRYILVEIISGSIFFLLFLLELATGGANLPFRTPTLGGVEWNVLTPQRWDLLGLTAYHTFLFSTLLVWSLMQWDAKRVPLSSWLTALCIAILSAVIFPWLQLQAFPSALSFINVIWQQSLLLAIGNGMVGALLGVACLLGSNREDTGLAGSLPALPVAMTMTAVVVGWPMTAVAAAGMGLTRLLLPRLRSLVSFSLFAFGQHLFWRQLVEMGSYLLDRTMNELFVGCAAALIAIALCWIPCRNEVD
jgi:prepilin signal peptidase PulO-like enzyme (type II secretory pathway)